MKLHEKIAWYRRDRRLSQEELAAQTGVSRQAVSKWELGESSPDVNKLLALARAFGVTTAHLLDDGEEPERPAAPPPVQPREDPAPPPRSGADPNLPGLIGRMVRRWGWLAGVYIALQGAGVALVGALARWGFGSMFAGSHQMMGGVGLSGGGWTYSGPPELEGAIMGELGVVQATPFSGFESFIMGFATVILAIGILMILGGLILAFVLWKNGKKGD